MPPVPPPPCEGCCLRYTFLTCISFSTGLSQPFTGPASAHDGPVHFARIDATSSLPLHVASIRYRAPKLSFLPLLQVPSLLTLHPLRKTCPCLLLHSCICLAKPCNEAYKAPALNSLSALGAHSVRPRRLISRLLRLCRPQPECPRRRRPPLCSLGSALRLCNMYLARMPCDPGSAIGS